MSRSSLLLSWSTPSEIASSAYLVSPPKRSDVTYEVPRGNRRHGFLEGILHYLPRLQSRIAIQSCELPSLRLSPPREAESQRSLKTRGNAAVCLPLETEEVKETFESVCSIVERLSDVGNGANSGVVLLHDPRTVPFLRSVYLAALHR